MQMEFAHNNGEAVANPEKLKLAVPWGYKYCYPQFVAIKNTIYKYNEYKYKYFYPEHTVCCHHKYNIQIYSIYASNVTLLQWISRKMMSNEIEKFGSNLSDQHLRGITSQAQFSE